MTLRAVRVLRLLCFVVLALQASLAFRGAERMPGPPLAEDSGHALTIARGIAQGHGPTAEDLRRTRDFSPLYTLLCVPLVRGAGGDPIRLLRLLLLAQLVIHAATAMVLARIARAVYRDFATLDHNLEAGAERAFGWLVAFLYLVAVGTFLQHYNGLETGLSLFVLVLAWRVYQRGAGETMANALALGLVLGLALLTRIDAAILLAIVCAGELLRRDSERIDAVRRAAIIGAVAISASSPWWLYRLVAFGSLVPTQPQFLLSAERVVHASSAWLADAVPWIYARPGESVVWDFARLVVLLPVLGGLPRRSHGFDWSVSTVIVERTRRFGIYLVAFTGALALWYCVSSPASPLYVRDLAALSPCATLALAFGVWGFTRHSGAVAAALAVVLVAVMGYVVVALHQGRGFDRHVIYANAHAPIIAVSIRDPLHRNRLDAADATPTIVKVTCFPSENHALPRGDRVSRKSHPERS